MPLIIKIIIRSIFIVSVLFAKVNRGFLNAAVSLLRPKWQILSTLFSPHADTLFVKSDFEEVGRIDLYFGMLINLLC